MMVGKKMVVNCIGCEGLQESNVCVCNLKNMYSGALF